MLKNGFHVISHLSAVDPVETVCSRTWKTKLRGQVQVWFCLRSRVPVWTYSRGNTTSWTASVETDTPPSCPRSPAGGRETQRSSQQHVTSESSKITVEKGALNAPSGATVEPRGSHLINETPSEKFYTHQMQTLTANDNMFIQYLIPVWP